MAQELSTHRRNIGLTMNSTKTKVMTNALEIPVRVDATELQYVPEVYLWQLDFFKHSIDLEVSRGMASAWKAFWSSNISSWINQLVGDSSLRL